MLPGFRGVEQSGRPYRLSRREMERRGRVRTLLRTMFVFGFLLVLQQPLRSASTGAWPSEAEIDASVPARLSLLVDVAMIVAYVVVAMRALELTDSIRPRATRGARAARLGLGLVLTGAVLDLVEDLLVWRRLEGVVDPQDVDLTLPWSWLMRILVLGGLGLSLVAAWW